MGRAGRTATVLLEHQEWLCWIRRKVHVGRCPHLWQWPSGRISRKHVKEQDKPRRIPSWEIFPAASCRDFSYQSLRCPLLCLISDRDSPIFNTARAVMDSFTTHREDLNSNLLLSLCPVSYFCFTAVTCKLHTSLKGFPKSQDMTPPVWWVCLTCKLCWHVYNISHISEAFLKGLWKEEFTGHNERPQQRLLKTFFSIFEVPLGIPFLYDFCCFGPCSTGCWWYWCKGYERWTKQSEIAWPYISHLPLLVWGFLPSVKGNASKGSSGLSVSSVTKAAQLLTTEVLLLFHKPQLPICK